MDLKTFGQAIVLEWSPSKDAKDHEVTWYPSNSNDPAKKKTKTVPTNGTQAIIDSDLEPLKYYTVELRARNDQGKGKPWKMVGVVVGKKDGELSFTCTKLSSYTACIYSYPPINFKHE